MKNKYLSGILCLLLVVLLSNTALAAYPLMHFDPDTLRRKQLEIINGPTAPIDNQINSILKIQTMLGYGTSMSLLDKIPYDPNDRNQGTCGDCWVWAGTGLMEIAHTIQNNIFDRLSIQFLNSCFSDRFACCGGWLTDFAAWYNSKGFVIPWSNYMASFLDVYSRCYDGSGTSLIPCSLIGTTPNYNINSISAQTIQTTGVGQANAISNIKNILNQNKGVDFGFFLANNADWDDFINFWNCTNGETEETLWNNMDNYCGHEWNDTEGSGHAVVIYGYNDDDPDPAKHYWLVLNSWGTAGGKRPHGFFRLKMQINYDCAFPYPDGNFNALYFETLDVQFTGNSSSTTSITSTTSSPSTTTTSVPPTSTTTMPGDSDGDGFPDYLDNCPNEPNGLQLGTCMPGSDKAGTTCHSDADCVIGCSTNGKCSMYQEDTDTDYVGDVCDNCPNKPNGPFWGTCTDLSTVCLSNTDCPSISGAPGYCIKGQYDYNNNGIGDVCDSNPGCAYPPNCGGCDTPACCQYK